MSETVIVGAGPYGLSIAAHFRRHGIPFRIFGRAMGSWLSQMPDGMLLKSDGFASNIYDPTGSFTLARFCSDRQIPYSDTGLPVHLETFRAYGLAFRDRLVPNLEDKTVVSLERSAGGFRLLLDDGEMVSARRVVLAVGISHFEYVPEALAELPPEFLTHSSRHHDLSPFSGRSVVVIGGGSSATDIAGLLRDAGTHVRLVSRRRTLQFHTTPTGKPRSWSQRIRHPQSGLGPGLRSWFCASAPALFHYLPESLRLAIVRRHLGPSGGWFAKDKVIGRVPLLLGYTPERAEIHNGKVQLCLRALDGVERKIVADHIIAATGYKVDLTRLKFLSKEILSSLKQIDGAPALSSTFEASIPGLYFAGIAAANSFGPVMRFAFGAGFAARRLSQTMLKSVSPATVPAENVVSLAK
jgi:Pyridine nucleotide-disulphide oxidoreductase